jgi:hypothetical protein
MSDIDGTIGICRSTAEEMIAARLQWKLDPQYIISLCDEILRLRAALESQSRTAAEARKQALEEAAAVVEQADRSGRDWVKGSLWETILKEASSRVRALANQEKQT